MNLKHKAALVEQAEAECQRQRSEASESLAQLKAEVRRGATPVRIVVSGLALGFASGLTTAGGAASAGGKLLSGPLFSMLLDTVVPGLLAGVTAAATASADEATDDGEAVDEASQEVAEDAPSPKPKRRRKPREPRRGQANA